ncbi:Serine/threonine-protein kinase PrkC [Phycisphaerae bacterium RAS1]|nr:Serine/threonine-protein kinase PrkC [Phycisphaerae bacterium RAS1]
MPVNVNWFEDDDQLLGVIRGGPQAARAAAPAIRGYDELVELARGGQGVVYRATQRSTGQPVAIKLLLDGTYASSAGRRRFEREIDLVASLRHSNIVRVYDSGVMPDHRPYCIMEYIEGRPLDQFAAEFGLYDPDVRSRTGSADRRPSDAAAPLRSRKSRLDAVLAVFAKVCDAVNYAHQRGVIHRDLKPSNIRVDPEGEPHVLDFGLAKDVGVEAAARTQVSLAGHFMGSVPWSSPEQALGIPEKIDVRTDVYALGVVLYQLLTGRFPYDVSGSLAQALLNIQSADPLPPRRIAPRLDEDVQTIALKCLAKEPERRYQTAGDLAADVRHYLAGEPIAARADSTWYVLQRALRRYRLIVRFGVALLLLSLGGAIAMSILYQQTIVARDATAQQRDKAQLEAQRAKQIQKFLEEMLASVRPARSRGRDVSVLRELLDESSQRVHTELKDQPLAAAALHLTMGLTYQGISEFEPAEKHIRRAIELYESAAGRAAEDTLLARQKLAYFMLSQSRYEEGEKLARELLDDCRRALGDEHRVSIYVAHDLAMLRSTLGGMQESIEIVRGLVETLRRTKGPEAEDTLTMMSDLAAVQNEAGQFEEARKLHEQVLEARQRILGPDHPDVVVSLNMLGMARENLGDLKGAEEAIRESFERGSRVCGPNHADTLIAQDNLARILQSQGRIEEAEKLFRAALERKTASLGPEHPSTLTTMHNLADVLRGQGKLDEAESLQRASYETTKRIMGMNSLETAITANNLGKLLERRGRSAEAEPLFREAVETAERVFPQGNWQLSLLRCNLGACLADLKRFEEAERLLLDGHAVLASSLGWQSGYVRGFFERIGRMYDEWPQPEKAARWRESAPTSAPASAPVSAPRP